MSDLSWFNPTPHAIAVYASRPLSPVATQHSLPSGRYSLLGPDFHRLDRTSLRLAHSFDHLVGDGEDARRNGEANCLSGLEVENELELQRNILHRSSAKKSGHADLILCGTHRRGPPSLLRDPHGVLSCVDSAKGEQKAHWRADR